MKYLFIDFIYAMLITGITNAQQIQVPSSISPTHPRLLTNNAYRETLKGQVKYDENIGNTFNKIKQDIDPYVTRHQSDPAWIVSRLMMFWKTRSTDVFV